jgi:glucokinase
MKGNPRYNSSAGEELEMKTCLLGFDVGGTKCAVIVGHAEGDEICIADRAAFSTPADPEATLAKLESVAKRLLAERRWRPQAIGISCGGPLDSRRGLILGPPNLPGWENVPVTDYFSKSFGVTANLQNDANACAYAEWKWGAGKGVNSMVFLTFGTGLGAGLIIDGRLYSGISDMAGEVGHVRLDENGPIGYGKAGSFEGFCSGAGIVRLARQQGFDVPDARQVFEAASANNPAAIKALGITARYLGRGLALIVDILNPELIVIGSIFVRQRNLLWPIAEEVLRAEALPRSLNACCVVPAALGEQIGDYAALSIATVKV